MRSPRRRPTLKALPSMLAALAALAPKSTEGAPSERPAIPLPPLEAAGDFVALDVPGFRDAVVSVPRGATTARPIAVALHGNFDRPEWQCEVWRTIVGPGAFVLCPRGIPRRDAPKSWDRWEYGNRDAVRKELDAGLEALRARFGAHVAEGPVLYTAFSLGAIVGASVIRLDPTRFPRAVLTEGGYDGWSIPNIRAFKKGGGERILIACAQTVCRNSAKQLAPLFEREGVEFRYTYTKAGHTYDGPVAGAIQEQWAWLTEGDTRWAPAR